jgi:guanylate kinase
LENRGDSAATIRRRMRDARAELSHYSEYDYIVFNDDRDEAAGDLEAIVSAARLSYPLQQPSLDKRINRMLREADKFD